MISRRTLLFGCLLFASFAASTAQSDRSILGYIGTSSFWMDAPSGWTADAQTAQRFGAIFVLVPPGATFNSAGAVIIGSSFRDKTVADAITKVRANTLARDPAAEMTEQPAVEVGGIQIARMDIRSKAIRSQPFEALAYIPMGKDVLCITLSALAEDSFQRGKGALTEMLKTYSVGPEVQRAP